MLELHGVVARPAFKLFLADLLVLVLVQVGQEEIVDVFGVIWFALALAGLLVLRRFFLLLILSFLEVKGLRLGAAKNFGEFLLVEITVAVKVRSLEPCSQLCHARTRAGRIGLGRVIR